MSEVEQNVVSVERILHYVKLDPEAPAEIPDAVPESWPSTGEVEFRWGASRPSRAPWAYNCSTGIFQHAIGQTLILYSKISLSKWCVPSPSVLTDSIDTHRIYPEP